MIRIDCPFCGPRDHAEFGYGGDAGAHRPAQDCNDPEVWFDYVFLRDNPRGRHFEFWHHVQGCRQWLRVERDTLTHEVFSVEPARAWAEAAKPAGSAGPGGSGPAGSEPGASEQGTAK